MIWTPPKPSVWKLDISEKEWRITREIILELDGYACGYCGADLPEGKGVVDHIIPLSRGGTSDWDNLIAACRPCNSSKHNRLLSEWKGRIGVHRDA